MCLVDLEGRDSDQSHDESHSGSNPGSSSGGNPGSKGDVPAAKPAKLVEATDGNSGGNSGADDWERKDVWDVCWAEGDPRSLAIMEKTRMFVLEDLKAGSPTLSSGYLACFKDMGVTAAMLDEIMLAPERPARGMVVEFETAPLRELLDVVDQKGPVEAYVHVEALAPKVDETRLWKVVAAAALNALELQVADKALVRCSDYRGIQLVRRLQGLGEGSKMKQRAEVAAYFGRFDEAEAIYRDMDRKDLAVDLRVRIGDWFKVVTLIQTGGAGDDKLLQHALKKIGHFYADRRLWDRALHYFTQAKDLPRMAECYFKLGDLQSLARLVPSVPVGALADSDETSSGNSAPVLLVEMASWLESSGAHEAAVECYLKAGEPRKAIDCAVLLNQWAKAVELAEEFDYPQIEGLLAKKAGELKLRGDKLGAVELYRKANKSIDAARMLAALAEEIAIEHCDPLRAKKLSVLAALEVERYRKNAMSMASVTGAGGAESIAMATAKTLDTLMTLDTAGDASGSGSSKVLDNAWRGAAAYHYYLLAMRQLYRGSMDDSMRTCIRLAEFEDILSPRVIYSLIALTAYHNKYYGVCSRAFVKLETMQHRSERSRDAVQSLAVAIFTRNAPLDPQPLQKQYLTCLEDGTGYQACTASGRLIESESGRGESRSFVCRTCRHLCLERMIEDLSNCPLCHAALDSGFNSR